MRETFLLLLLIASLALSSVARADSGPAHCQSVAKEVTLGTVTATAGIFANFWNSKGSLSYESRKAFDAMSGAIPKAASAGAFCPQGCHTKQGPSFFFRSTPRLVLSDYEDAAHCNQLYAQTQNQPLRYEKKGLHSLKEAEKWIGRFSRGKGTEGESLYERCDGSCSPRYSYVVTTISSLLTIEAQVVCGPARDQEDDTYELEYGYRWSCEAVQ
ncbi:MAG: hypothetical protein J0M12_11560 [Deltaproteobacteria bacterium]|nr:hypothetical protein [Deltaproteobacteria bacterium]